MPDIETVLSAQEKCDRIRLIRSDHLGPITFHQLMLRFGTARDALAALPSLVKKSGRRAIKLCPEATVETEIERTLSAGAEYIHIGTVDYPVALAALPDAPPVLVMKGDKTVLQRDAVAVVGARNASAAGIRFTRDITRDLGKGGLTVVSGLARGIDTAAHEGALATGTIAVMAGGVDIIYPPENRALFEQIAETGLIVCELPIGTKPLARHFPQRNRLISGLSRGVLVVEAALRSGSLITARQALDQGRDVYAVPGSPLDPRHRGTNDLIRQGAILVENADDILGSAQGSIIQEPNPAKAKVETPELYEDTKPDLTPDLTPDLNSAKQLILEKLGPTPIDVDEIIRQSNLTADKVLIILQDLEMEGRLERHAGNRVTTI